MAKNKPKKNKKASTASKRSGAGKKWPRNKKLHSARRLKSAKHAGHEREPRQPVKPTEEQIKRLIAKGRLRGFITETELLYFFRQW